MRAVHGWDPGAFPNAGQSSGGLRHPLLNVLGGGLFFLIGVTLLTMRVRDTLEFRNGVHTVGVVRERGESTGNNRLWVAFTTARGEVSGRLPATTNVKMLGDGDRMAVVYQADHPERVVAERDIGSEALLLPSGFTAVGLGLAGYGSLTLRSEKKQRVRGDAESGTLGRA